MSFFAKVGSLALVALFTLGASSPKPEKKVSPKAALEAGDTALRVSQINSCGTIDRIPWFQKSKEIRTRRIFKDELKLVGEKAYNPWELHQVLRPNGLTSFVFQKLRKDGYEEYLAARGEVVEKIIEIRKGKRRSLSRENYKPLINRAAIGFVTGDGSRVEFMPGQTGKSTVVIYPTNDLGVAMAPVYLKGISCDKPETLNDADINSRDLGMQSKEDAPKGK